MRNIFSTKWWMATMGLLLLVALISLSRVSLGHAAPLEQILSNKEFGDPAASAVKTTTCDIEEFTNTEANFQGMVQIRAGSPGAFSDNEYRIAALNYIASAEECFHATNQPNIQTNNPYTDTVIIDHGGVGDSGFDSDPSAEFVTRGRKWGLGSPYPGGSNTPGPGISGGLVTYSYIANGVGHVAAPVDNGGTNTDVRTGLGVDACVQNEITTAFAAWSAIANIQFAEVVDNNVPSDAGGAVGDIRIGAHPFDGPSRVLAHAYFPPPTLNTIAGDMHFDNSEIWACTPSSGVIDIGIVTLHEIGHSIGLNHEPSPPTGNPAIMNPIYDPTLTDLLLDDINGITSIYGQIAPPSSSISGQVTDTSNSPITGVTIATNAGQSTTTDSNGNYTFSNLPPASYTLTPAKSGCTFSPASRTVSVPPNAVDQNFSGTCPTSPGGTLVGVIYHARTGQRIAGAKVTATCTGAQLTTDARGYYRFDNLPVGLCRVTATKAGYKDGFRDGQVIADEIRWNSVALEPISAQTGTLIGIIYNAKTGQRIAAATVTACTNEKVESDFYGFYRFINLPVGTCRITATKADYQTNFRDGLVMVDAVRWNSIGLQSLSLSSSGESADVTTLPNQDEAGGGTITILDLAFIAGHYGSDDPTADLNIDGIVDIIDLVIATSNYHSNGSTTDQP